jgi:tRNA-splicing ligase RtcB
MVELRKITDYLYEIPKTGAMRVPGRIYISKEIMQTQQYEEALKQVANVAHLPGILKYSYAMPDFHWGYGFPIGGVAAFNFEEGIISPGGVGYDINCGVRLLRTNLTFKDIKDRVTDIIRFLYRNIPAGVGSKGAISKLSRSEMRQLLVEGAKWAVRMGYGKKEDLEFIEDNGTIPDADPDTISNRAYERGFSEVGTLGSGNHFLELQVIEEVYLKDVAEKFGIFGKDQVVFSVHCGSRGFGHQVCDDYIKILLSSANKYGIRLPDRQLACAPLKSREGKNYLGAMAGAANFAFANRQVITALVERTLTRYFGKSAEEIGLRPVYDVCHNIAKIEEHEVDGKKMKVCVHRKGATRAFPPGHPLVPEKYRDVGQPVLIPGDMGRCSYVLVGAEGALRETFASTCHGAGRVYSRSHMKKTTRGRDLKGEMQKRGVFVMAVGWDTFAEEMPDAYKDVSVVVDVVEKAKISYKVVKLRPLGVVKG